MGLSSLLKLLQFISLNRFIDKQIFFHCLSIGDFYLLFLQKTYFKGDFVKDKLISIV